MELERCRPEDVEALRAFLEAVDLTLSGLDAPSVRLWVERDETGAVVGSTGYEISADGCHALIRSVAVRPTHRSRGSGSALATFALTRAAEEGARTAWLFSRRSGPFWQSLGFEPADRDELAAALAIRIRCGCSSEPGNWGARSRGRGRSRRPQRGFSRAFERAWRRAAKLHPRLLSLAKCLTVR